jgi:transposase-like protein
MRNRTCTECGSATTIAVKTAALGRFAYLCADCDRSFQETLRAAHDLSLRGLDRLARTGREEAPRCR